MLERKGRELVAQILRQTGRDRPGVTVTEVEPFCSAVPYKVRMEVIAYVCTHMSF